MERRKFLIGMGSLAAGSAAALGTGAFTQVEASREMSVTTAGDASANLQLTPHQGAPQVSTSSGELVIDLSDANESASTEIRPAFTIKNNLTESISTFFFNPWRNNDLRTSPEETGPYSDGSGPLHFPIQTTGAKGVDVQFVALDGGKPVALIDRENPPVTYMGPGRPENNWSMRANLSNSSYTSFGESNVGYLELAQGESMDIAVRVIVDGEHFDGEIGSMNADYIAYGGTDSSALTGVGITKANF